jgi:hypothetical protein
MLKKLAIAGMTHMNAGRWYPCWRPPAPTLSASSAAWTVLSSLGLGCQSRS